MTGGTLVATAHGPDGAGATNHNPLWSAEYVEPSTRMTGPAPLAAYCSGAPGMAASRGGPSYRTSSFVWLRLIAAVCGMSLAITASRASGVPGTEASTSPLG